MKKILSLVLSVALILAMGTLFMACDGDDTPAADTTAETTATTDATAGDTTAETTAQGSSTTVADATAWDNALNTVDASNMSTKLISGVVDEEDGEPVAATTATMETYQAGNTFYTKIYGETSGMAYSNEYYAVNKGEGAYDLYMKTEYAGVNTDPEGKYTASNGFGKINEAVAGSLYESIANPFAEDAFITCMVGQFDKFTYVEADAAYTCAEKIDVTIEGETATFYDITVRFENGKLVSISYTYDAPDGETQGAQLTIWDIGTTVVEIPEAVLGAPEMDMSMGM